MAGTSSGVRAPYRVVRNGVDLSAWTHAHEGERQSACADLGLKPGRPLAVCVGRLCKQKGQADLVAAWPLVRSSVPDACLVLVGDGPDRALLEQRCAATGGITLTGERNDVAKWMAAADVVVVPSRWDGMALVVVEAMARGRSVVATCVPGIADALPRSAGAVVALDDRRALARELIVRLRDPMRRDAEGAAGRRYVELNLDQAVSAEAVVTIYDELVRTVARVHRSRRLRCSAGQSGQGPKHDLDIGPEGPVVDVVVVERDPILDGGVATKTVHLSEAG
jgi:glycosyltransferase involved in cell wall biosynthesis